MVVESCLTEGSYWLSETTDGSDEEAPAYIDFRAFIPGEDDEPVAESLLYEKPRFLDSFDWKPEATMGAYQGQDDVEFGDSRIGILSREGFDGESELLTRDHRGVVALEQEITVTPPWGGMSIKVLGHFQRAFRSVTMGVPAPFSRYTAIFRERDGDGNRFRAYYEQYRVARSAYGAAGGNPDNFPEFPVAGMGGSIGGFFVTTAPSLPGAAWNVDALFSNPGDLSLSSITEIRDAFAVLASGSWQRLVGDPVEEFQKHLRLLDASGLGARSSFEVQNMADLAGFFGDGERLQLEGVIHVKDQISLEHKIEGRAILWTDSPKGVTIRGLTREGGNPQDGGLLVVATRGNIRLEVPAGTTLPVSLLALKGTVKGLDGVTLQGHLFCDSYPPGLSQGVGLERPTLVAEAPAPGRALEEEGRKMVAVIFDQGIIRKEFRRRRQRER
jgi:hypothetical protein